MFALLAVPDHKEPQKAQKTPANHPKPTSSSVVQGRTAKKVTWKSESFTKTPPWHFALDLGRLRGFASGSHPGTAIGQRLVTGPRSKGPASVVLEKIERFTTSPAAFVQD